MLLLAVLVSWKLPEIPIPNAQDLIEINLGNDVEGFGKVQPLIKGEKAPSTAVAEQPRAVAPATVKAKRSKQMKIQIKNQHGTKTARQK